MTCVEFNRHNSNLISFTMSGHADSAEEDKYDLVCSGISAISICILNGILEVLKINATYSVKDGFLNVDLSNLCQEDIEKCQVLMETMLLGLKSMEISYGDYIKVKIEEV